MSEITARETTQDTTLPNGWVSASLMDLLEIVRGISFPSGVKTSEPKDGYIACLRTTNVQRDVQWENLWFVPEEYLKREEQLVKPLDILISTANSFELVGKVAQVLQMPVQATLGAFISLIRVSSHLDAKYFYFQLSSSETQERIRKLASTTTNISNVSTKKLRALALKVPPLAEQRRIVTAIEEQFARLDAGVSALERARANLKRYRASVLKAAVEGRLTQEWREENPDTESGSMLLKRILEERRARWEEAQLARYAEKEQNPPKNWRSKYKEPDAPDIAGLPELAEGWVWTSTEQLGEVIGGLTKNQKRASYPTKLPYLSVANVYADQLRLDQVGEIGVREEELSRALLEDGDLLVVEGNGSPDQIGRVAVWSASIVPCVHQNHLIKVRFSLKQLAKYTLYWLLSTAGREYIRRVASSTSGLYTLSITKVQALPVPLPPLAEQKEIIAEVERRLSVIEEVEAQVEADLKRAARLRQSILKRAFEGKLVSQNPSDEPASALLERIREERELATAKKSQRKNPAKQKSAEEQVGLF